MPFRFEPSLSELLSDPIARRLMERDGTSEQQVRAIAMSARRRMMDRCRQLFSSQAVQPPARLPSYRSCRD